MFDKNMQVYKKYLSLLYIVIINDIINLICLTDKNLEEENKKCKSQKEY